MIHMMKIDDDADANLLLVLTNKLQSPLPQLRERILSVTAVQFTKGTRGYIVVSDDGQPPPEPKDEEPVDIGADVGKSGGALP